MAPDSASFGDVLKRYRKAAGLTQEELAQRAKLSRNAITTLERGVRQSPRRDTIALLATALALSDEQHAALKAAARLHRLRAVVALPEAALSSPSSPRSPPVASPERPAPLVTNPPADVPPLQGLETRPHNLPVQPNALLGREDEVREICALLRHKDVRLLTFTGPGGIGKTHLALQVGAEMMNMVADGVWFVSLSCLADPALVLPTIAQTLGLQEAAGRPLSDLLRDYVRMRQLLLVLDNFEQVAEAAPAVAELLAHSPGLTVLVTSRMALHLQGEHEYPIPPLALPVVRPPARSPSIEEVMASPAVALFVARAQAHVPDFHLTRATAPVVAAICTRLDGLPLAITLAAAQIKVLPPPALLRRLGLRLPLLTGGARDLPERQHTMRATLDWSYDLLPPEEQRLFRRLAVFMGGCTLEATEAVCATPAGAVPLEIDVLDGLGALIDQSLLLQRTAGREAREEKEAHEEQEAGEPRFRMLDVIHEYALEQLEASGEAEVLQRAYAAYYVARAEQMWAESIRATDADAYFSHVGRLEPEQDNLRAALAWLRARAEAVKQAVGVGHSGPGWAETGRGGETAVVQGLRLAGALVWLWAVRDQLSEGRKWLEAFLALDATPSATGDEAEQEKTAEPFVSDPDVRRHALYAAGVLAYWQGDLDQAVLRLEQSLALSDRSSRGAVLNNLGMAVQDQGDVQRARACYEEGLALGRALGQWGVMADTLFSLSRLTLADGDLDQAGVLSAEALAICRQKHYLTGAAGCLLVQALIAWRRGHLSRAAAMAEEAVALQYEARDVRQYWLGLETCALIAATQRYSEQAAYLLGAAAAARERIGMHRSMFWHWPLADDIMSAVAAAQAALGEEQWAAAFVAGQAVTPEEVVAKVLDKTMGR
jgi:predicted ATPase/transcriptional regulator with XRE-family HTH domain